MQLLSTDELDEYRAELIRKRIKQMLTVLFSLLGVDSLMEAKHRSVES